MHSDRMEMSFLISCNRRTNICAAAMHSPLGRHHYRGIYFLFFFRGCIECCAEDVTREKVCSLIYNRKTENDSHLHYCFLDECAFGREMNSENRMKQTNQFLVHNTGKLKCTHRHTVQLQSRSSTDNLIVYKIHITKCAL